MSKYEIDIYKLKSLPNDRDIIFHINTNGGLICDYSRLC
jgi:hypothetical protein